MMPCSVMNAVTRSPGVTSKEGFRTGTPSGAMRMPSDDGPDLFGSSGSDADEDDDDGDEDDDEDVSSDMFSINSDDLMDMMP